MSEIKQYNPQISVQATLTLNESEMRALHALAGYGTDAFLKVFYQGLGMVYLKPHEAGLRSLFEQARKALPPILARAHDAREVFKGAK